MSKKGLSTSKIFSLDLISSRKDRLLAYIGETVGQKGRLFLVTPNPEFVIASKDDPSFLTILQKADIAIPDGIGLIWAGEVLPKIGFWGRFWYGFLTSIKVLKGDLADHKIEGSELWEDLCQLASKKGWSVYLLGGRSGVAKKALGILQKRYPAMIGWADEGPDISSQTSVVRHQTSVQKINDKRPTFLFVALGMKKQEQFIWENWRKLKVNIAMGVGGAFDQIVNPNLVPPEGLRKAGLGWFYRLLRQPWRFKRQLALLKFIWLVLVSSE